MSDLYCVLWDDDRTYDEMVEALRSADVMHPESIARRVLLVKQARAMSDEERARYANKIAEVYRQEAACAAETIDERGRLHATLH
ncbi:hypothetical protein [Burkholderia sp. RF2-non_BP3]|uniref:hypothetical protein n=1 Tax=Burkholderia sp. RF2-non_BP3 TaxID=1637844 RepID=UPI000752B275|nr:hypothetical protein [Burkholderia sp. RF2-non_BP3]KUY52375.1 hypothetical protein WS45_24970 [Burkholderia sp. RF2-non_BP3]